MFDVIGKRNWFFLFSGLIVVPGLLFILLTPLTNGQVGLKFSVDYTGGTVWQIQFKDPNVSLDEVRTVLVQQGVTGVALPDEPGRVVLPEGAAQKVLLRHRFSFNSSPIWRAGVRPLR